MKNSIEEEMKTFNKFNNFQRYFYSNNSFKKEDINNSFYFNNVSSFYPHNKKTISVVLSKPTEKI